MAEPPNDDPWKSVLNQVEMALDALNLQAGEARTSLIDGVRDALEASLGVEVNLEAPPVVVLEGGKDESKDTEDREPPDLRVVAEAEGEVSSTHEVNITAVPTDISVQVIRQDEPILRPPPTSSRRRKGGATLNQSGVIRVGPEEWQTIYRGSSTRTYRVGVQRGVLHVALDGELLEQVGAGTTIDVEASLIRVRGGEDAAVTGAYCHLV